MVAEKKNRKRKDSGRLPPTSIAISSGRRDSPHPSAEKETPASTNQMPSLRILASVPYPSSNQREESLEFEILMSQ